LFGSFSLHLAPLLAFILPPLQPLFPFYSQLGLKFLELLLKRESQNTCLSDNRLQSGHWAATTTCSTSNYW